MSLDLSPLNEIAKHHHQTNEYRGAALVVAADVIEAMRALPGNEPAVPLPSAMFTAAYRALTSLPVLVDEESPPGGWKLIDRASKDVILDGTLEQAGGDER